MTKLSTTVDLESIKVKIIRSLGEGELGDVRSYLDEYFPTGNFSKQELVNGYCTWNFDSSDGWYYDEFDNCIPY